MSIDKSSPPNAVYYLIHYDHCGVKWSDTWTCACNDDCPECGHEIEPYDWEELS